MEWTAGADTGLVHTLLDDDAFRTSVTHLLLFLTAGTILVVNNSAQILWITLLKMDPHKMKKKQKPQIFCLVEFAQHHRFLGTEPAAKARVGNMTGSLFFCV